MGLCETSVFSIFTFIKDNDLKFCTRSYNSCVYHMMRFKGSNGKVGKTMTSHSRTLYLVIQVAIWQFLYFKRHSSETLSEEGEGNWVINEGLSECNKTRRIP